MAKCQPSQMGWHLSGNVLLTVNLRLKRSAEFGSRAMRLTFWSPTAHRPHDSAFRYSLNR